jgi:hypothetical protein
MASLLSVRCVSLFFSFQGNMKIIDNINKIHSENG